MRSLCLLGGMCLSLGVLYWACGFGKPEQTPLERLRGLLYDGTHEY